VQNHGSEHRGNKNSAISWLSCASSDGKINSVSDFWDVIAIRDLQLFPASVRPLVLHDKVPVALVGIVAFELHRISFPRSCTLPHNYWPANGSEPAGTTGALFCFGTREKRDGRNHSDNPAAA
jgi:hypothetical protein